MRDHRGLYNRKDADARTGFQNSGTLALYPAKHLKGINTPRFLVFLSGWHHARKGFIRIDEWGCMQSGFIKRKQEDFEYYCAKMMEKMEVDLSPVRMELKKLFIEYASLKQETFAHATKNKSSRSIQDIRAENDVRLAEKSLKSKRRELFDQMVSLQKKLETSEIVMEEELLAAAARMRALLSCYCHGVLYHWRNREWSTKAVPEVSIENRAYHLYHNRHKEDDDYMKEVIRYAGKIK